VCMQQSGKGAGKSGAKGGKSKGGKGKAKGPGGKKAPISRSSRAGLQVSLLSLADGWTNSVVS
jgi:hypothetical protein